MKNKSTNYPLQRRLGWGGDKPSLLGTFLGKTLNTAWDQEVSHQGAKQHACSFEQPGRAQDIIIVMRTFCDKCDIICLLAVHDTLIFEI